MAERNWWQGRWLLLSLVLASALPLLWPETPPLVDLPGIWRGTESSSTCLALLIFNAILNFGGP